MQVRDREVKGTLLWRQKKGSREEGEAGANEVGRGGMFAVAAKDISVGAHVLTWLRGYSTRGRWVFDIDSHEEFELNTFMVETRYEARSFSGTEVPAKIFMELFDEGMGSTNHIFPDGVRYVCKSGTPIKGGNRYFVSFSRG